MNPQITDEDGTPVTLVASKHESQVDEVLHNLTLQSPLSPSHGVLMDQMRAAFKGLAAEVDHYVPDGRHKSIAYTHIEEACRAAIAGIVTGEFRY